MKFMYGLPLAFLMLQGCSNGGSNAPDEAMGVSVYIDDGAVQCGREGRAPGETARLLEDNNVDVLSSTCGYITGLAVAEVCGMGDSNINIHFIAETDLARAEDLGFAPTSNLSQGYTEVCVNQQTQLDKKRSLWYSQGLEDYQYTYRRVCFCPPQEDIVITVEDGVVTEAFYTPSGVYLAEEDLPDLFTVDGLFNEIQQALDDNVDSLDVSYHGTLGYPLAIKIDPLLLGADEEMYHYVSDFQ